MKKILIIIFSIAAFLSISNASAADFLTGSNKVEVSEGETFDISVYVNSQGAAINSAEGSLTFPSDLVSVVSVNNAGSIFPIWVEQPSYSNTSGSVSFNGGVPNPGYAGSRGYVAKVTFKAKKAGKASIAFGASSIYSNDGSGTDVLNKKSGVSVLIKATETIPVVKEEPVKDGVIDLDRKPIIEKPIPVKRDEIDENINNRDTALPPMPVISSKDLTDGKEWFTTKNIMLDWDVPGGVTAVQFSFGGKEDAIPTSIYSPAINFAKILNIANGVSYFHIRFKNSAGWGEILHKKIMVDSFLPGDITGTSVLNDKKLISLSVYSEDLHSGIDRYEAYVDGKKVAEIKGGFDKNATIDLPLLKTGQNKVTIIAYDVAGNKNTKIIDINSPEAESPQIKISKIETKIDEGNNLSVYTYPNTEIVLYIKDETGKVTSSAAVTGLDGSLSIPIEAFKTVGLKTLWVSLNNDCEDMCVLSEKLTVEVVEGDLTRVPKEFLSMIRKNYSGTIPWLIAIIFMLLYLFTFKRNKNKDIIQELNKAEIDVYKIFKVLKNDAKRYKAMLKRNKIDIVEKDQVIIENLEKDLEEAETYFAKRIEKIEKELE